METTENSGDVETSAASKPPDQFVEFKKPILIGKIGKLPRKIISADRKDTSPSISDAAPVIENKSSVPSLNNPIKSDLPPALLLKEKSIPLPYKEPKWSGLPPQNAGFSFEVLKSGTIVENVDLADKAFHVFGRLSSNDIIMAHPTISRYHAVIQYKAHDTEDSRPQGFYIYDLGSSHGTFLNKTRLKANHYVKVNVGQFIRLGCSTRQFILQGPEEERDEESELSITEMKLLKEEKRRLAEQARILLQTQREEAAKKEEEDGISWGMAEDAEEETDLSENPYAQASNEELYLDDPKKTLRGFMEREGLPLEYDCQERGVGQFVCRVELPIEDARGNPVIAEVIHKGKKKDAVVQCALEACRIIDRHGLLRQAKHESRKRKSKDWKEDDFYDSDDDNFLDRTGAVEKKREGRMKRYAGSAAECPVPDQPLTYDTLVLKCSALQHNIADCEKRLAKLREKAPTPSSEAAGDVDVLDAFMDNLGKQHSSVANKADISKTKMELQKLKIELAKTQRLVEIAKPASLPVLVEQEEIKTQPLLKKTSNSVIIGKRLKIKSREQTPYKPPKAEADGDFVEEVDSENEVRTTTVIEKRVKSKNSLDFTPETVKDAASKVEHLEVAAKKTFGPMRPPANYIIPAAYFEQETDRDLPEIMEESDF